MSTPTSTPTPGVGPFGETRSASLAKVQCAWCSRPATWQINEPASLSGVEYACTAHGTEWYPDLFPGSDTTPIEAIVASIPTTEGWDCDGTRWAWDAAWCDTCAGHGVWHATTEQRPNPVGVDKQTPRPWYPLMGHRSGLRANDLVTLASALFVLSLEGGTAHQGCDL